MGIAYRSDHDLGLTIVVGDGIVTAEDWRAHVRRMTGDPVWPVGRLGLTDQSTADTSAISGDDIRESATAFGSLGRQVSRRKGAIVAGDAAYRSAATFQQTRGPTGLRIRIFSDRNSACNWLRIAVEAVTPIIDELRFLIRATDLSSGFSSARHSSCSRRTSTPKSAPVASVS